MCLMQEVDSYTIKTKSGESPLFPEIRYRLRAGEPIALSLCANISTKAEQSDRGYKFNLAIDSKLKGENYMKNYIFKECFLT